MKQKDCDAAPQGGFELLTSPVSKIDYGRGECRQLPAATTAPSRGGQKRQKDVEVSEDQNGKRLHHQPEGRWLTENPKILLIYHKVRINYVG